MKRVLLMLAATAAFACTTAYAQAGGGAGAGGGQAGGGHAAGASNGSSANSANSTGGTGSMADQNSNGQSRMGRELNGDKANKGGKDTVTGCLSATAGSDGTFTLTNDKDNSQIQVGPSDKLQAAAGKKVKLTGTWSSAAGTGENASTANAGSAGVASSTSGEQSGRRFEVKKVKELSGSCSAGAGSSGGSNPPPSF